MWCRAHMGPLRQMMNVTYLSDVHCVRIPLNCQPYSSGSSGRSLSVPVSNPRDLVTSSDLFKRKVLIAGAGPVGAFNACYFALNGWDVEVYEFRKDIRTTEPDPNKTFNISISARGAAAFESIGMKDYIIEQGVEKRGLFVHHIDGKRIEFFPFGRPGQHMFAMHRQHLVEALISRAEKFPNVKIFFEHKVKGVDFDKKELIVQKDVGEIRVPGDLVLACDGAYSTIRRSLQTFPRFDYSQEYVENGYIAFKIEAKDGKFALDPKGMHLWPRGNCSLIAIPVLDKTFSCSINAPFEDFEKKMSTVEGGVKFFRHNFPDLYRVMGEDAVAEVFKYAKPNATISIKCKPHAFGDFVVLLGDSAHAMVPFLGQGLNCGLEDCLIFGETLTECSGDLPKTLKTYSDRRVLDAQTATEMAKRHFYQMNNSANANFVKLRAIVDFVINFLFPRTWIPFFSMIYFTRIPYAQVMEIRKWQDKILSRIGWAIVLVVIGISTAGISKARQRETISESKRNS